MKETEIHLFITAVATCFIYFILDEEMAITALSSGMLATIVWYIAHH